MFGVHVGEGEIQSQKAPEGVDVSVMLVQLPEQIFFVKGGLSDGAGLIVIGRELVGPGFAQLVFVPYTCMFPEVAFAAKSTKT
jgi:hypothetical protein